jgi:hypothetical protein
VIERMRERVALTMPGVPGSNPRRATVTTAAGKSAWTQSRRGGCGWSMLGALALIAAVLLVQGWQVLVAENLRESDAEVQTLASAQRVHSQRLALLVAQVGAAGGFLCRRDRSSGRVAHIGPGAPRTVSREDTRAHRTFSQ